MKVFYPGPAVSGVAATETQIHPTAGRLVVGENEIADDALAAQLVASGLVTAALAPPAPDPAAAAEIWHSGHGTVFHDDPACTTGNNIEPENRRDGTGGLPRCSDCAGKEQRPSKARRKE